MDKSEIKDLARMSGATDEIGNRAESVFCFTEPELVEFYDRIIKEVISVINGRDYGSGDESDKEIRQCITAIKEHFWS